MRKLLFTFIILLILVGAGWGYWTYFRVYSDGIRVGILRKFSKKGNIFKTYEGEIVPPGVLNTGAAGNQMFRFSVIDPVLADSLSHIQGTEVELHYTQFLGALPWRGDGYADQKGQYIVEQNRKSKRSRKCKSLRI